MFLDFQISFSFNFQEPQIKTIYSYPGVVAHAFPVLAR